LRIDRLLWQPASPLGLSLTLCLLGLLLQALGRRRWGAGAILVAVVWLGVWSLPAVSDALRQSLEGRFANLPVAELPVAEAAVVLGGAIDAGPPGWPYPDLGSAADRVWQAARIFHAGKAKRLILSGGRLGWQGERLAEAQAMGRLLADLGVPAAALVLEERSRSTRENALYSAELIRALGRPFDRVTQRHHNNVRRQTLAESSQCPKPILQELSGSTFGLMPRRNSDWNARLCWRGKPSAAMC